MKPDVHGFSPVLTSFVGRADAVRDVTSLLGSERQPVVIALLQGEPTLFDEA